MLSDKSIDIERFGVAKSATQSTQGFWQGMQRLLRWSDDPDANDYVEEGTPSRDTEIVKVCSSDEADVNDPEEWAPVRVIKSMKSRGGSAGDQNYQDRHVNDETVQSRKVTVRKIEHYDTNIDDAAQAAFDADPTRKAYVVRGADYTRDDTTKDDTQFVEHEIVEFFKPRTNERHDIVSQVNQNAQVKLLNQYLIDESADPDGVVVGDNGINPPYRLDPWQNIVNVNFGLTVIVVFFCPNSSYPLKVELVSEKAKFLGSRSVGVAGFTMYFVKVPTGIKDVFAKVTLPGTIGDASPTSPFPFPLAMFAITCPLTGDDDKSMDDAQVSALNTALSSITAPPPDFTTLQINAAPGVLFCTYLHQYPPGVTLPWKITNVKHRDDKNAEPPNKMVQCFPLSISNDTFVLPGSFGGPSFTFKYSGFEILSYRLDRKGKGAQYTNRAWHSDSIVTVNGVPESSTAQKFPPLEIGPTNDLPLVSSDVVTYPA